jgi:four helix bundle protein
MDRAAMMERTKAFALRIIRLVAALPKDRVADVLGRQLLKSGTSIGANYREAVGASSRRQFITTLEIAQRECEETLYWIDLIRESGLFPTRRLEDLLGEAGELRAILTATIRTAKNNNG